jgi:hypothetical protein
MKSRRLRLAAIREPDDDGEEPITQLDARLPALNPRA